MKFNPRSYAESLLKLAETATKQEIPRIVDNFITFLVKERQFSLVHTVLQNLEDLARREEGKVKVVLDVAQTLDEVSRKHVLGFLGKNENNVEIEERIDPGVLGGARIRLHDLLIDATISGQLERMREQMR